MGPIVVTTFAILRTLANLTRQIPQAINRALWPELTSLEAQGQDETLQKVHIFIVKFGFLLSFCIAIVIHFSGKDIVALWTHSRITYDARLMNVFLLFIVLQIIWQISATFQSAFNRPCVPAICSIISAVMGLILAYFLTLRYGAVGTVLGLFIAELLICGFILPFKTCQILRQKFKIFLFEIFIRSLPLIVSMYIFAYWFYGILWPIGQIFTIFLLGITVIPLSLFLGYFLWLNKYERIEILSVVSKLSTK